MELSGQKYRCKAGETFDSIAVEVYGNEVYACELLGANPTLCMIPIFSGGEVLDLPVVDTDIGEDEEAMQKTAPWKG